LRPKKERSHRFNLPKQMPSPLSPHSYPTTADVTFTCPSHLHFLQGKWTLLIIVDKVGKSSRCMAHLNDVGCTSFTGRALKECTPAVYMKVLKKGAHSFATEGGLFS